MKCGVAPFENKITEFAAWRHKSWADPNQLSPRPVCRCDSVKRRNRPSRAALGARPAGDNSGRSDVVLINLIKNLDSDPARRMVTAIRPAASFPTLSRGATLNE
jgi:hypothetical protein